MQKTLLLVGGLSFVVYSQHIHPTMVWKTRPSSHHRRSLAEFSVEVIKTSHFAELKIHSSASSFEIVYAPPAERRVGFSQQVRFVTIRNREDITPEEREELWFCKADLRRMRRRDEVCECPYEAQDEHVREREPPRNEDWQEALLQLEAVSVVLNEQARQREQQISDPDLIARKYRDFVERSHRSMFISNLAREEQSRHRLYRQRAGRESPFHPTTPQLFTYDP